jgi:hypothetical protein
MLPTLPTLPAMRHAKPGPGRALLATGLLWLASGLTWLAGGAAPLPGAPAPRPLEYEVKAAFLFNFAKFVEWPPESFREHDALAICVFGEDPFGGILESTVAGEKLGGRPLQVRQVERASELKSCQIVFISQSERERVPEILAGLRGANVLTVGENGRFAEQGGMVRFFLEANRVRFEINLDALERTRLLVSSKLLRVARVVRPESRGH